LVYLNISWFLFALQYLYYLYFITLINKNRLQKLNKILRNSERIIIKKINQINNFRKKTIQKPNPKIAEIEKKLILITTPENKIETIEEPNPIITNIEVDTLPLTTLEIENETIQKPIPKIAEIEKDLILPTTPEIENETIEKQNDKIVELEVDSKLQTTPENANEIGLAGELYVINYEKKILKNNNKIELADKVTHVSMEFGDSAGFDILSYELNGDLKFIEVKTTQRNTKQFILTINEKSKMLGEKKLLFIPSY
jgi:hypothetical protein